MAYKLTVRLKRRLVLFPLMDVFFILLIFYLFVEQGRPTAVDVEVPRNTGAGTINVLIQVLDANSYAWIDSTAFDLCSQIEPNKLMLSNDRKREFLEHLTMDMGELHSAMQELDDTLRVRSIATYSLLVRCPNDLPYVAVSRILRIMQAARGAQRIKFSVLGGSVSTLGISRGIESDGRTYFHLDFQADEIGHDNP